MKQSVRRTLLFTLLAATVFAAIWPQSRQVETAPLRRQRLDPTAVPTTRIAHPKAAKAEMVALAPPDRFDAATADIDPFGVKSWTPAPPPTPKTVAPETAPPSAPPLPFTYAGRLEAEPGRWTIYLVRGEQTFAVTKGDVFDGTYRFDGEESGNLLIQFLPLSITQKLQLSTEN